MGFESLLGNERLIENISRSISRGRISHFYLICGPAGSGKRTLAKLLGAAILCKGENKPCGVCPACRKALGSGHPDLITIDEPEKKTVSVDLIRQARADIYIQPNEADRKIYVFPRAQDMGIPSQNALLKVLEEPPAYGVFILLTDNPEKLLPTVRSRCTELSLSALPDHALRKKLQEAYPQASSDMLQAAISRSGGFLGQALSILEEGSDLPVQTEAFLKAFAARNTYALLQVLVPMEKWKRDQLIPILQQWTAFLEGALVYRSGVGAATPMAQELTAGRSAQELMTAIRHLQKSIEYAQGNVSPAAICGYLQWALR
ncbi:MAG: DNA polymerase III subunit [Oscillospiraceae bacterium]|nr:DNA polymerase III subunit [Oscillospiraceae bacterium]